MKIAIFTCAGVIAGLLVMFLLQNAQTTRAKPETPDIAISAQEQAPAKAPDQTQLQTPALTQALTPTQTQVQGLEPCQSPVTNALAQLNAVAPGQVQTQLMPLQPLATPVLHSTVNSINQSDCVVLNPGQAYSETASGYPIYTGSRAVDSAPVQIPLSQVPASQVPVMGAESEGCGMQIGRNGLLQNPCVDPPSVHGLAYGRHY